MTTINLQYIKLPTFSDIRGNLSVLQDELPFKIRRTYWIYGANEVVRGGHRHISCRQGLVSITGSINIKICVGKESKHINLSDPSIVLIVEPHMWHEMYLAEGSVLLAFASHEFDEKDYIYDICDL